ncbi:DUF4037 domain-containing protein [Nocardia sp. NPDC046473]|uniref:DUF4037 domain-containing protein n=1 Tax=Nocardia sp. NPDC046473 TaxID=3155733 RepID=UPI0033EA1D56
MEIGFVPGVELSGRFYGEVVAPLINRYFGALPHTAARIGAGSEVLGFDTERSMDHEWGPRLQIFLRERDIEVKAQDISAMLAERLPKTFLGYPTHFAGEGRIRQMQVTDGPVFHRIEIAALGTWFATHLGFDPRDQVTTFDWLATPTQTLAEVTAGAVFHDGLAELEPARSCLAWYPPQVWRYVLACQWERISQEEAFVGRCGEVGDELGSAIVAARQVRDLIRLCLLMNRRYPPYSKWLGSAFAQLPAAAALNPVLSAALAASDWREREEHLSRAYETVAAQHNQLGLTEPLDPGTRWYYDRPFRVLDAGRFAVALREGITDPDLRATAQIGAIDQYVDSAEVLEHRDRSRAAAHAALDPRQS